MQLQGCWKTHLWQNVGERGRAAGGQPVRMQAVKDPREQITEHTILSVQLFSFTELVRFDRGCWNWRFNLSIYAGTTVGKRYARTDELGIPFGVTVDAQTQEDNTVTVRERDTTRQVSMVEESLEPLCPIFSFSRFAWTKISPFCFILVSKQTPARDQYLSSNAPPSCRVTLRIINFLQVRSIYSMASWVQYCTPVPFQKSFHGEFSVATDTWLFKIETDH